jgi:hypothetical protein
MNFDGVIAEAAFTLWEAGYALEESGSVEDVTGWNALVIVSTSELAKVDDTEDLADRLHGEVPNTGALVWIREVYSTPGIRVMSYGTDGDARSGTDIVNREWDIYLEEAEEDRLRNDPEGHLRAQDYTAWANL